jgi:N-acetylglucosaminyldiphosphoundecaprenol N-acetyl-beta-D-mannosaminyltransferase
MSTAHCLSLRTLPYQSGNIDEVALRIAEHAKYKRATRLVLPVNGQVFVCAYEQPKFAELICRTEEVVLDGFSVVMAQRLLGKADVHRVSGVDLIMNICRFANVNHARIMLFGGRPGAAEKTIAVLRPQYPNLIVATHCPPFGFEKSAAGLEEAESAISAFAPDIIFVALGCPKQEFFMDKHLRHMGVPIAMAVGGSFEMIGGMIPRAPRWVQTIGMEWFFRMVLEPRRLAWRYAYTNTVFLWVLLRELLGLHVSPESSL